MSGFSQTRNYSTEQLLKEGYMQMAELNLSLAMEAFSVECEACDCNESHLIMHYKDE